MAKKFEIKKAKDGQFFFSLHADNNEKILSSEMYKAKKSAQDGIASVKTNAGNDGRYERKTSKNNKHYFVLKAANNEVIGTSQEYSDHEAMEQGIAAVKRDAPLAPVEDNS